MKRDDFSEDQNRRVEATLARIRAGLDHAKSPANNEPAHVFVPEAHDDRQV